MKKFNLFQENVKEGDKITVVTQGEFGGVLVLQMTYVDSTPTAHYYGCPEEMCGVTLLCKLKGRRVTRKMTLEYSVPLVVYKGYVSIDADSIVYLTCGNKKSSRFGMHDPRYFTEILEKYPNGILFSDIPNQEEGQR